MKALKIIFLTISVVLALFILYVVVNCMVSYKYEIEPHIMSGSKVTAEFAAEYMDSLIAWLLGFVAYIGCSITFIVIFSFHKSRRINNSD
jgi:hypothetical protein